MAAVAARRRGRLVAGGRRRRHGAAASGLDDASSGDLIEDFSEPNGYLPLRQPLSNEDDVPVRHSRSDGAPSSPAGVYLGVGPEQNFTYIVALQPRMAFIVDIRRGNLHEHLMYKALFELSADRADFLSRLFSRDAAGGLGADVDGRAS